MICEIVNGDENRMTVAFARFKGALSPTAMPETLTVWHLLSRVELDLYFKESSAFDVTFADDSLQHSATQTDAFLCGPATNIAFRAQAQTCAVCCRFNCASGGNEDNFRKSAYILKSLIYFRLLFYDR